MYHLLPTTAGVIRTCGSVLCTPAREAESTCSQTWPLSRVQLRPSEKPRNSPTILATMGSVLPKLTKPRFSVSTFSFAWVAALVVSTSRVLLSQALRLANSCGDNLSRPAALNCAGFICCSIGGWAQAAGTTAARATNMSECQSGRRRIEGMTVPPDGWGLV